MSDLLVPGWGCKLSASAPALDNYPLECLIERRGPGFIAERFVKPPVDIVVEFPCPISFTRILLNPSVGSHASSLLALAASASPAAVEPSLGPRTNDTLQWHELGTWRLWPYTSPQAQRDALFCIDNPAAVRHASAASSDSTQSDRIAETRTIAMGAARGLANLSLVRRLRLRILRTHEASPVALSALRVLGLVTDSTHSSRLDSALRKAKSYCKAPSGATDEAVIVATLPAPKSFGRLSFAASPSAAPKHLPISSAGPPTDRKRTGGGGGVESINTDPDHLDPITGELMTDPVVLPSGHTVDRGTITRHLELHPTNPFTGLPLRLEQIVPDLRRRLAMDLERRTKAHRTDAVSTAPALTRSPRGDT